MAHLRFIYLIVCVSTTVSLLSAEMTSSGILAQYCDFEMFEARCAASHEVVVMAAASYGRRETGRCLPSDSVIESLRHDPRYFGCSTDVLHLADNKCSGRSSCNVAIPDSDFERVTPCYKDSRKYLEAKYDCVKVVDADRSCVVQVSTSPVHISSSSTQWTTSTDTICGSVHQPWTLRAQTGQHIRVHLLDFTSQQQQQNTDDDDDDEDNESSCKEYGYVDEMHMPAAATRRQKTVICGDQQRDKLVVESSSNVIHIVFNQQLTNHTNFLLRFYAVGCLDVRPPADAWMRRLGSDMVEIGCYMTRQVWVLRCVDNQFVGVIGNCSQHWADNNEEVRVEAVHHKSVGINSKVHVLAIVAVTAVGLAICLTVICVGLLCLRNQKRNDSTEISRAKYQRHLMAEDCMPAYNEFNATETNDTNYNDWAATDAGMRLQLAASQHHV